MTHRQVLGLHRLAIVVAGATLILVTAGASVTSTGSGLAVPDWPLSFGTLFPPMEGGVFFEHGHRMIAGVVIILMTVLTLLVCRWDERRWLRRLCLLGLGALLIQALLGGLTVLLQLPTPISVSHAGLAMAFFGLTVSLALFTSPRWRAPSTGADADRARSLIPHLILTTGLVYTQILLGAIMRHTGAGLAIPDFPLSFGRLFPPVFSGPILINFAHRLGAVAVVVCALPLCVRVLRIPWNSAGFVGPTMMLANLLLAQLVLGAITVWTGRSVVPTTAHVAFGAAILASSLALTLRTRREAV